jgi:plasmid stabilization system protein ParE
MAAISDHIARGPYPMGLSGTQLATDFDRRFPMPRGDKSKYTDKQKRQAEHIEEGYKERGVSSREAASRAWATVNAVHGGGEKRGGGGYGKEEDHAPMRKGGRKGGRKAGTRSTAARSRSRTRKSSSRTGTRDGASSSSKTARGGARKGAAKSSRTGRARTRRARGSNGRTNRGGRRTRR